MKGSTDREHHTLYGRRDDNHEVARWKYVNGCRHPECVAANAEYQRTSRAERAIRLLEDPTLAPHGREGTYSNWDCRCLPCCEAHAVVMHSKEHLKHAMKSYRKRHPVVQRSWGGHGGPARIYDVKS